MPNWIDRLTRFWFCDFCQKEFLDQQDADVCEDNCAKDPQKVEARKQRFQTDFDELLSSTSDTLYPIDFRCPKCGKNQQIGVDYGSNFRGSIICENCRPSESEQPYGV